MSNPNLIIHRSIFSNPGPSKEIDYRPNNFYCMIIYIVLVEIIHSFTTKHLCPLKWVFVFLSFMFTCLLVSRIQLTFIHDWWSATTTSLKIFHSFNCGWHFTCQSLHLAAEMRHYIRVIRTNDRVLPSIGRVWVLTVLYRKKNSKEKVFWGLITSINTKHGICFTWYSAVSSLPWYQLEHKYCAVEKTVGGEVLLFLPLSLDGSLLLSGFLQVIIGMPIDTKLWKAHRADAAMRPWLLIC